MKTEYIRFTNDMIPEAGALLARRHACDREILPLLPPRFQKPDVATKAVEELWKEKYTRGYAAFRQAG